MERIHRPGHREGCRSREDTAVNGTVDPSVGAKVIEEYPPTCPRLLQDDTVVGGHDSPRCLVRWGSASLAENGLQDLVDDGRDAPVVVAGGVVSGETQRRDVEAAAQL